MSFFLFLIQTAQTVTIPRNSQQTSPNLALNLIGTLFLSAHALVLRSPFIECGTYALVQTVDDQFVDHQLLDDHTVDDHLVGDQLVDDHTKMTAL